MAEPEQLIGWDAERLSRRALSAASARQAELRHAVRVSAAVGAAFAAGALLHLPQGYWAVFTAVIVVQTSIGATLTAGIERLLGTVVGGLVGVAAAYLKARTVLEEGLVLSGAIALLAFAAAVRPSLRVAPITAAIVLVGGGALKMDPLVAALWRVVEILIGSAIGVAATLLIFPARASKAVLSRGARAMELTAGLLETYAAQVAGREGEDGVHASHQASRKVLAQVEQSVGEAARERRSGLGESGSLGGLLRSLLRVRHDVVMVGRALNQPLPSPVADHVGPVAAQLLRMLAEALRETAGVALGRPAGAGPQLERARAEFEEAVERMRQARVTAAMDLDAAARVYGLVFALESLLLNLKDLQERVEELTGRPVASAPSPEP